MEIPDAWRKEIEAGTEFGRRAGRAIAKVEVEIAKGPKKHPTSRSPLYPARPREPVGTALAAKITGLLGIKAGSGCNCKDLAAKMDDWGIEGCDKKHRGEIIDALVANKDMLSGSLAKAAVVYTKDVGIIEAAKLSTGLIWSWLKREDAETEALAAGANWLLNSAIEEVRSSIALNPPVEKVKIKISDNKPIRSSSGSKGVKEQQAKQSRPKAEIIRRHGGGSVRAGGGVRGAFTQSEQPRFVSSAQLQQDILLLLSKIPSDVTAIAGVARSGLSVATMLAMYLHLPMITIRQTMNDIVPTGNGWRIGGSKHVNPKLDKILVVDDTVMTGNSLKAIRPLVKRELGNAIYAAVYVNPLALVKPDIWAVDLPWPHILEWNVFNSILSPSVAVDFDGILCRDCPAGSDDDGPKYLDFINNAKPLYVPRRTTIPMIVTARIEKYRGPTMGWLNRHGIKTHNLVMHQASTLKDREKCDIPAYKATHYMNWAKKHKASPGPIMFMESEDWQARRIAEISKLMVVCPHTAKVY